jgi:hypothetical protein
MALRAKFKMRTFLNAINNIPHPELAPKAHVEGGAIDLQPLVFDW